MDGSPDTESSVKRSFIRRHRFSWKSKTPKAYVYDLAKPERVTTEEANEQNSMSIVPVRTQNRS